MLVFRVVDDVLVFCRIWMKRISDTFRVGVVMIGSIGSEGDSGHFRGVVEKRKMSGVGMDQFFVPVTKRIIMGILNFSAN